MGTILRHGSDEQKQRYLPRIASGELRLQAFGVTEPTAGSDTTSIQTTATRVDGGWRRPRPEDLDVAGALLGPDAPARAHDAGRRGGEARREGLSTFIVDMKRALADGTMTIRPIKTLMNHATTEIFLDGVVRAGRRPRRRGGQGFRYILDGMNAERDPDRGRVHRRRPLVRREGDCVRVASGSSSAGRSARTRASSSRSRRRTPRSRRPT